MALNPGNKLTQPQIADAWAKITIKNWQKKIEKLKIVNTRQLIDSFLMDVISGANGDTMKIQFAFKQYGRFLDMGVGRGVKIGDVKQSAVSRKLEGKMIGNRRKPAKWYTKTLRSETLRLTEILAEYYGKSAIDMIIQNPIKIEENYGGK